MLCAVPVSHGPTGVQGIGNLIKPAIVRALLLADFVVDGPLTGYNKPPISNFARRSTNKPIGRRSWSRIVPVDLPRRSVIQERIVKDSSSTLRNTSDGDLDMKS